MSFLSRMFNKRKVKLADCESLRVEEDEANHFLGGFKEYQPIIYDLPDNIRATVEVNDLLVDKSANANVKKK